MDLKFKDLPQFEKEEEYKFLLDILNQILSISDDMLNFFLQFSTLEKMSIQDKINFRQFLEKNELHFQRDNLNSFKLFGFHRVDPKNQQIKLIKIAEWKRPNYICKKNQKDELIFIPTLNTWSSFNGTEAT